MLTPTRGGVTGLEVASGEVPVDAANERPGRRWLDPARLGPGPMRQKRMGERQLTSQALAVPAWGRLLVPRDRCFTGLFRPVGGLRSAWRRRRD